MCVCMFVCPQERGIDLPSLPEQQWDHPLGAGSGAGVLFGTTGGVMEAALRTVSACACVCACVCGQCLSPETVLRLHVDLQHALVVLSAPCTVCVYYHAGVRAHNRSAHGQTDIHRCERDGWDKRVQGETTWRRAPRTYTIPTPLVAHGSCIRTATAST